MTDSGLQHALRQHFSVDTLARDPALLQKVLTMLGAWLTPEGGQPYPVTPLVDLLPLFNEQAIPVDGMAVDAFLDELGATVLSHTARLNHPMYIGHMTQSLPWVSVIAEAFTAVLNQNQVKIETAYVSTLIEKQILGWMHRKVYQSSEASYADAMKATDFALGNIVNGGTMGNLTALAVALEHQLPGTRREGLAATLARSGHRGLAVLASSRAHYSLKKALATLGMGEQALHAIPVDHDHRIDLPALEAKLAQLRRENIKVITLVGIAGTTETGAIDPLPALADIAAREQAWFHVDAAWGGALLLSPSFQPLLDGIARADSVVIDGHKLFWVPMAQGMVLFRERTSLDALKHNANYIIRSNSGDLGQTSLEGSRRFDALKLWTSFKVLGENGYTALLQQAAWLSGTMRAQIKEHQDFELTSDSQTFILTYRFVPLALRQYMAALAAAGRKEEALAIGRQLNAINEQLQEIQKSGGNSFVSRTVLDAPPYPEGISVLRVVLTNVTTTSDHVRAILAEQLAIGQALLAERDIGSAIAA